MFRKKIRRYCTVCTVVIVPIFRLFPAQHPFGRHGNDERRIFTAAGDGAPSPSTAAGSAASAAAATRAKSPAAASELRESFAVDGARSTAAVVDLADGAGRRRQAVGRRRSVPRLPRRRRRADGG